MALKDLEKKLYQKASNGTPPATTPSPTPPRTEPEKNPVETSWSPGVREEGERIISRFLTKLNQVSRRVFWILIIIILIMMGAGGFYFYQYLTTRDATLSLKTPTNILIGVPFNIEVNFQNNSDNALQNVKLSMILPEGTALVAEGPNKRTFSRDFGNLEKGENIQEKIPVIIFGNEQSLKRFTVNASYLPSTVGLKAQFEKNETFEITAQEPAIKLDLATPQKVLNDEDFEIEARYQNISDIDFSSVELQIDYPRYFTFKNAIPASSISNNIWKIGNLTKNSDTQAITIHGNVISAEESFFEIKGSLRVEISGQKYLISQKSTSINIASSPLSSGITLNDQLNYIAHPGENLKYVLAYRNNSDMGLNDVVTKVKLIGEMFDFSTLKTQGFFNSRDNTITWNTANTPELRLLNPGAGGRLEFEVMTLSNYPIKRLVDKNFTLKLAAEISSPTVPYYVASDKTIGLANLETKVGGKIVVNSQIFNQDPAPGGITNKGSLPLTLNQPTNFTIHWQIINYSTDVRDVEIKTFLQSGVRWTEQIKSNVSSTPTYNERTQEVSWLISKIPAAKGIVNKPIEVIFQIEATPDVTQLGKPMPFTSETSVKAFDEFGNVEIINSSHALNSQMLSDYNFEQEQGLVVQ